MTWTSTVPGTLNALVAAFKGAPGLEGVSVFDGPTVTQAAPMEALTVGYGGDPEVPTAAVDGQTQRDGMTAAPSTEQYSVQCAAAVLNGSGNISAARERAYALYAEVGGLLADDPTLTRTVLRAQPGAASLSQDQTPDGALAVVAFTVEVEAFTRR